ncbi:NFAT activation molecule 1 [Carlito syrichta]|uniref:NFAT activation molecule 1 n=1 Tax=Carlito syrichta TaxID=1868482 RepID=A0A1U7U2T7_CARSF|nr:NFAT activation molecule 1 [Carlito syrichta]
MVHAGSADTPVKGESGGGSGGDVLHPQARPEELSAVQLLEKEEPREARNTEAEGLVQLKSGGQWLLIPSKDLIGISEACGRGGQSVTHNGLPIMVSLANTAISFSCKITYPYTPEFKDLTVSYFHENLQGQRSSKKMLDCPPGQGVENQTHTFLCVITFTPPGASATGTYYCSICWSQSTVNGEGTFILVRDTGYREPPQNPQKSLLVGFTGFLAVLSVLGTALLLWKKKQMQAPGKHPTEKCPDPRSASNPKQPPTESVYTALQRRETEVYACIESEDGSPPTARCPLVQEKQHRFEDESELNLVYENL